MRPTTPLLPSLIVLVPASLAALGGGEALALAPDGALAWQQWRGPRRDGALARDPLPDGEWKPALEWSVDVGEGHSSPVASEDGEAIFVLSRLDGEEIVWAFDAASGEELWSDAVPVEIGINPAAHAHGKWPRATPVVVGERLLTFGITAITTCYDVETGDRLWRFDALESVDTTDGFCGSAMTPLVDGERAYVHIGDDRGGELVALDLETGERRASWKGDGPGYASPIVLELDGSRQLVTLSDRRVLAFALPDLELVWSLPFEDKWIENIQTPIRLGGDVVYGGIRRGLFRVHPEHGEEGWTARAVWSNRKEQPYMSTPVVSNGLLVGMLPSRRGELFAIDPESGELLWKQPESLGPVASLFVTPKGLLVMSHDSRLIEFEATREGARVTSRHEFGGEELWAHPLFLDGGVVLKTRQSVSRWRYATGE